MFNDAVYVGYECHVCGKYHEILVSEEDYWNWQDGELAQNAFPYLSANEQEFLAIGICPSCWERLFGEDEKKSEYCDENLDNGWEL